MASKIVEPLIAALNEGDEHALRDLSKRIKETSSISSEFVSSEKLGLSFTSAIRKLGGEIHDEKETEEGEGLYQFLYELYQLPGTQTKRYVMQFVPFLVTYYLEHRDTIRPGIEALLVGIYNEEVVSRKGTELLWTPPRTSAGSVYKRIQKAEVKTPRDRKGTATHGTLTERSLKVLDVQTAPVLKPVVLEDILPKVSGLGSADRDRIVRVALKHFNAAFASLPVYSILEFCELVTRLSKQGVPNGHEKGMENGHEEKANGISNHHVSLPSTPRVALSDGILQEFVNGITLALFKREQTRHSAHKALRALHARASYELATTILISTNALMNIMDSAKGPASPDLPPADALKVLEEETKMKKEEKVEKPVQNGDNNAIIPPQTENGAEDSESDSSSDEKEVSRSRGDSEGSIDSKEERKRKEKAEKKQRKAEKKLEKKQKKEKKKHEKADEAVLHGAPNHDPEFSY